MSWRDRIGFGKLYPKVFVVMIDFCPKSLKWHDLEGYEWLGSGEIRVLWVFILNPREGEIWWLRIRRK